jgi:signal transduction histidine kinase
MNTKLKRTDFASPERLDQDGVDRQARLISEIPLLCRHFDAIPNIVLILNQHRQIVYANRAIVAQLGLPNREALYGLRPGEALNCVRAEESDAGCGTTSFCRECGAVKAILSGLDGSRAVEECRVTASPYCVDDERFVVFVIADISHEKRREVLEKIFFHDVSNILTTVMGCVKLMPPHATPQENELAKRIATGVKMLADELGIQQSLLRAEDGRLSLELTELHSLVVLREVIFVYMCHDCARGKILQVDDCAADVVFYSDKTQLSRVIGNMVKNALESSSSGESVRAGCELTGNGKLRFWVHNSQHIAPNIQAQIFIRSFSTKGIGRGVGTYSMKLLGEQYLKGTVYFTSSPEDGTTFSIVLPVTTRFSAEEYWRNPQYWL